MEIKVTKFENENDMGLFSGSRFELGDNAAKITWDNCMEAVEEYRPYLNGVEAAEEIDPEKEESLLQEIREHVREYGAWDKEEIDSWSNQEVYAIFLQDVAASIRELEYYDTLAEVVEAQENGQISGRLFLGYPDDTDTKMELWEIDDLEFYFYLGL